MLRDLEPQVREYVEDAWNDIVVNEMQRLSVRRLSLACKEFFGKAWSSRRSGMRMRSLPAPCSTMSGGLGSTWCSATRASTTIGKLFFHILGHIRALKGYENFQIYCDTPAEGAVDYWKHPYRHSSFLASEFVK